MRLCFISNPNSIHTQRWLSWFANQGHEVCLIADNPVQRSWYGTLPVYDLASRFHVPVVRYLPWVTWTRQIIRRWQPDIVHAHRVSSAGWMGAFSGFHPLVITPWGSDLYQHPYRSKIARSLAYFTLRRADLVTADSEDLRQQAIRFGADPQVSHVVQWGVDLGVFSPARDPAYLRGELDLHDARVVLSPRGVHPIYNLETIVETIPLVRSACPKTVFIMRDYNTDASYMDRLERLVAELGVQDAVRWVGQVDSQQTTADLYRLADVVVSVPSSDGTPVSVLEAMACGAAIVASDLPSLREWITEGENGLLVPVKDSSALAAAIVQLLSHSEQRAAFGQFNRKQMEQRANHQVEMSKMEILYRQLLEPHRSERASSANSSTP